MTRRVIRSTIPLSNSGQNERPLWGLRGVVPRHASSFIIFTKHAKGNIMSIHTVFIVDPTQHVRIPTEWTSSIHVYHFDKINLMISNRTLQTVAMRAGYVLKSKPGTHHHEDVIETPSVTTVRRARKKARSSALPKLTLKPSSRLRQWRSDHAV